MALNHVSFSQVFLASMVLILVINGKAHASPESPFCTQTHPGEEKILCNDLVNGAPSWDVALSNVVDAAIKESQTVKPTIDGLGATLPSTLKDITKDSLVGTCGETFQSIVNDLNSISASIKANDGGSINTRLSAVSDCLVTCTDGLDSFGVDTSEIKKLEEKLWKLASLGLAVSATKPT